MTEVPFAAVPDPTGARGIVANGYDQIADRYQDWTRSHDPTRAWFVEEVIARVPSGSDVVELGMGSGGRVTEELEKRYRYIGIDLSPVQVSLARECLPGRDFRTADLVTLELPESSRDAVIAAYVMGHIPVSDRDGLFGRISRWLRPHGWFCAAFPIGDRPGEDIEPNWLGAPMFFASLPWERESRLLQGAGFSIDRAVVMTDDEDGRPVAFRWVFARLVRPT